jgi:hypothetical protein
MRIELDQEGRSRQEPLQYEHKQEKTGEYK